jgi:hypothetical protein
MLQRVLPVFLALALMAACKQDPKKEADSDGTPQETTTEEASPQAQASTGEVETTRHFCFASKTPTPEELGDTYNYQFTQLHIAEDGRVTGSMINAPYGTDGSRGSISGVYREDQALVQTTTTYLAEGELYEEQRDYKIGDDGLATLNAEKETVFSVPAVTCDQFESYMKEYHLGILKNRVNTTDRSRLKKVKEVAEFGYSEEELDNLRFLEVETNLDNNYETREFLLYIMDSMVCGSGGCNLLVIDETGKTLSNTTVVKLPVYMPTSTVGDMDQKGTWKSLYVWSQGFRKLTPEGGKYPPNASMAPEVPEDALSDHPEKYKLLLDYLE